MSIPCPGLTTLSATDTATLNFAINCFNGKTEFNNYVISIDAAVITLSGASATIDNPRVGVSIQVSGNGNTLDGADTFRGIRVDSGTVEFDSITIRNGNADGEVGNGGGGIAVFGGTVTTTDSTISNNNALVGGGAGVAVAGVLTVVNSTVSNNSAITGGGLYSEGSLIVVNSSVSNNTATSIGGGLHNAVFGSAHGTVDVVFPTITANEAPTGAGVSSVGSADNRTTVSGSIIAGNTGGNDVDLLGGTANSFSSDGFNVIGSGESVVLDAFDKPSDVTDVTDPGLRLLADNGGPTLTHYLMPGSPAIDRVTGTLDPDPSADQRGVARPFGLAKDSGSLELTGDDGLTLLAPCVVYDSVDAGDGALVPPAVRTLPVAGECGVPASATSVVFTVIAISPQGIGNLRLSAAGVTPAGGVLNYTLNGLNNSNTVTVPLSAAGAVDVAANNSPSDVRLVAVGFYSPTGTLNYFPLTPCAVADSRTGTNPAVDDYAGPFAAGADYPDIDVVGPFTADQGGGNTNCDVPAGADGVVVNVVSVSSSGGAGGLAVGAGGTQPSENTTNFNSIGLNNAAVAYVPVDGNGRIALNITGLLGSPTTQVRLVVLGYVDTGAGDAYIPVNPCAAFDTRTDITGDNNIPTDNFAGKRVAGNALNGTIPGTTTYNISGAIPAEQGGETNCAVPEGATAVLINLVAIQPDSIGNFRAYATGTNPTGGVLNFNNLTPPVNNSNAVVVPLDASGNLDLFINSPPNTGNPTVHARGVILGYYA